MAFAFEAVSLSGFAFRTDAASGAFVSLCLSPACGSFVSFAFEALSAIE